MHPSRGCFPATHTKLLEVDICVALQRTPKWLHKFFSGRWGQSLAADNVDQNGRLTQREQQVAALVCIGLSNKLVARKLNVSEGTIKLHLHSVFRKLRVRGRTELAITFLLNKGSS